MTTLPATSLRAEHFIQTTFIDFTPTKDDPLGNRGYAGWKMTRRGKQYGAVIALTKDPDKTFAAQCDDAMVEMLKQMLSTCKALDEEAICSAPSEPAPLWEET